MDEQVIAAMARWPNVPAMFGWLRLDRRGNWFLIDRQVAGFDATAHGLGSPITSPPIIDFIARNYACDPQGRWYWQNGPQCIYVDIDLAPLILRVMSGERTEHGLITHCGDPCGVVDAAAMSQAGDLWLSTARGPAVVHDLDLSQLEIEFDAEGEVPRSLEANGARVSISLLASGVDRPEWAHFIARPRNAAG